MKLRKNQMICPKNLSSLRGEFLFSSAIFGNIHVEIGVIGGDDEVSRLKNVYLCAD